MSENKTTHGRRIRLACVVFIYATAGAAVLIPLLLCAGFLLSDGFSQEPNRRVITDPGGDFTDYTGLAWPASAAVVSAGEVRNEFLGDGEFYLIFDADHATLEEWLAAAPPWEQGEWHRGPVPSEIGWHCGFGTSGMGADPAGSGPDKNIKQDEREQMLGSKQIWYVAKDHAPQWEHGEIFIIDPAHNRVWLSRWDF